MLAAAAAVACGGGQQDSGPAEVAYDLVVAGGTVVDGSGEERFRGDVAIEGERIAVVSRGGEGLDGQARDTLDADGLIVAPGFIDHHNHVQNTIHRRPLAENFIRQGITTLLPSLHSGDQPWPLDEYTESLETAPNVGFFAGHSWTREQVMGMDDRAPTDEELAEMKEYVRETMEDGALGLSTGLLYVPANYAETEEVIALAEVAARYGGIYYTHMRDEASELLPAVREAIRIGSEAGLPVQINHFKVMGPGNWGMTEESLALVDSARREGLDVKVDLYPYTAGSTGSSVLFPQWVLAGGIDSFRARVSDPERRERVEEATIEWMKRDWTGGDLSRVQFRRLPSHPEYDGQTLADLAADRGIANSEEAAIDLVIELQLEGGFSAIYHFMSEDDVIRIMEHPHSMFDTDGDPLAYGRGFPHPRSYGAFPRVLSRYVREMDVLSLEEAIRKMSSMSAERIGQDERGLVREGMYADLTVLDFEEVRDKATYVDPHQYSAGIVHVVVNGVPVLRDASLTGAKPGKVLEGPARPENVEVEGADDAGDVEDAEGFEDGGADGS